MVRSQDTIGTGITEIDATDATVPTTPPGKKGTTPNSGNATPFLSPSESTETLIKRIKEEDEELEEDEEDESILDRIKALQYMVPYRWRRRISDVWDRTSSFGMASASFMGNFVWFGVTTSMVVLLPTIYAFEMQNMAIAYENERKLHEQMIKPGGGSVAPPPLPAAVVPPSAVPGVAV